MPKQLNQIVTNIIANIAFWFGVAIIYEATGSIELRNFAAILAFLSTLVLWIVLAVETPKAQPDTINRQKNKRGDADDVLYDPRLALLLQMMTDDERQTLQARLLDDLASDGEIPLADLLAAKDEAAARGDHAL